MAKSRFTKGDRVVVVSSWDDKGQFVTRPATVYSCGKVRVLLTCDYDDDEFGQNMKPESPTIIPADEFSEELAMQRAEAWKAAQIEMRETHIARIEKRIADGDRVYDGEMPGAKKRLEEARAFVPSVITYPDACAEVDRRVEAELAARRAQ